MLRIVTAMLVLVVGAPAAAQTVSPADSAKKEPKICQREQVTGTRLGRGSQVCHTAAEWKQIEDRQRLGEQRNATSPSELVNPVPRAY